MKRRIHRITEYADGFSRPDAPPLSDEQLRQAQAHRHISELLADAFVCTIPDHKLSSLSSRVLARARSEYSSSFTERLLHAWHNLFKHPVWALSSAMGMLLIVSASLWLATTMRQRQPVQMESFVIYQTDDGNGFVRYFKYYKVDNDGNKLYL